MAKKFELWLDESGKFEDDRAKKVKENPSLIGGVLVEKDIVNNIEFEKLVSEDHNHATEMDKQEKKRYLLDTLEKVKEGFDLLCDKNSGAIKVILNP